MTTHDTGTTLPASTLTAQDRARTADYARTLQHVDGAFSWTAGADPDLGATSTALRVLKECGQPVPHLDGVLAYIAACFDQTTHGFTRTPGGQPGLSATAQGHVALATLGRSTPAQTAGLTNLVGTFVTTSEDLWIVAPFLDTLGLTSPDADRWTALAYAARNPDGTWGNGGDQIIATASHASSLVLLGAALQQPDAVHSVIRDSHHGGAWPDRNGNTTLEATYHVSRAVHAMHIATNSTETLDFLNRCRRADGSYAPTPGQEPGNLVNSYFALTIDRWITAPAGSGAN